LDKRAALIFIFLIITAAELAASGRQEEVKAPVYKDEWILCITGLDTKELNAQNTQIGSMILSALNERLNSVSYRTRVSPEYAYYEEITWAEERAAAARALSAKQNERSAFLYRGEPQWRYQRSVAAIDEEIRKLRANLEEIENNAPLISREPVFKIASLNLDNIFPIPPKSGTERRFCTEQGIDAFTSLSISEFHGRFLLDIKLYTVYTNSFSWQDSILFSYNDLSEALDEIIQRLLTAISGNRSVSVTITAEPGDALILVNSSFAGRGGVITGVYPPGTFIIDAAGADYERLTYETYLTEGQTLNISLILNPVSYGFLEITSEIPGSIYQGALYMGETPVTLRLPFGSMEYIEMETQNSDKTAVVFQMPSAESYDGSSSLQTQQLSFDPIRSLETGNLNADRSFYYWVWGGTWITGILTWVMYNTYIGSNYAVNYDSVYKGSFDSSFYNYNQSMYYATMGTAIAFGAVASYGIYRLVRYIITADRTASAAVRTGRN